MEKRFGATQVTSLGTYTTMQLKAAITDLARCEGISIGTVRRITSKLRDEEGMKSIEDFFRVICGDTELREFVKSHTELINDAMVCLNTPKAASIHACGTVIFPDEKTAGEWVPMKRQQGLLVTEWEGSEIEEAGFLKEDILGIAQLDKLANILKLIEKNRGIKLDLYKDIPLDDPEVFKYIAKGFLSDVFHFGAKGLSTYCVQMKPESLDEMGICAALYRPGPIENNIHNEYVLTKNGELEKEPPIGGESILEKENNFMCFQEDIMRLCQKLADFNLEDTDGVRKSIGKKNLQKMASYGKQFVEGYVKKYGSQGVTEEYARDLWKQMEEFGKYSFNKCLCGDEKIYPNDLTIEELYKKKEKDIMSVTMMSNGRFLSTKVKEIRPAGVRIIYRIRTENEAVTRVSGNHKFPTCDGRKVCAYDLKVGDELYSYEDGNRKCVKIVSIDMESAKPVYDVEIDHLEHNFVTGNGIVTCNSHAIAYSRNGYNCIWLKVHYPIEFWSTTFSFAEIKDYPFYINEIQKLGNIIINPVDINKSDINIVSDLKTNSMYWALNSVKQCGEKAQEFIHNEREANGEFFSLDEFIDRCVVKNSPINKSVIENLIYSGAFDGLEHISKPHERLKLIESYRENKRVKVLEDKDLLTSIIKARKERNDWWWLLQQKKISGFATFDYESLIKEYHQIEKFYDAEYFDVSELKYWDGTDRSACAIIGGFVIDIIERKSKKGLFAIIILESNYEFINVTVFPEMYSEYGEFLKESKNNILMVDGYIQYDKWRQEYVLQTNLNTSFTVLS